jgi:predicted transcriptional regulator
MNDTVKDRIHKLVDTIHDEKALAQVMDDVAFYSSKEDVADTLSASQLEELEAAMKEADNGQVITWADFKDELGEWRRK